MAGAVSAGAYTAGVIDYLLETLALWEQAKEKNRKILKQFPEDFLNKGYDISIPMHEVSLEVISGASAGGITGTLALLSLLEGTQAVNKDNPTGVNNKLYDCWVNMADDKIEDTFSKMMATTDIVQEKEVRSLLNAEVLDIVANKALTIQQLHPLPNYIAADLDLILTISNLKGIQYLIDFESRDDDSGTVITNHSGFFRYRIKNKFLPAGIPDNGEPYYVLDLTEERERNYLKEATLSTAAFPIGLPARQNSLPKEYLDRYTRYIFGRDKGIKPKLSEEEEQDVAYHFTATDGGLINNEPFGYALRVLKEKCPEVEAQGNFGMIMIDPFPNYNTTEQAAPKSDIISVAIRVFGALRNQVLFRQEEILNALDENNQTRFMIAPARRLASGPDKGRRVSNPIASGALGGFAGFLDRQLRDHDFYLGRQNCQSFLRYHFAINRDKVPEKFGVAYEREAVERFGFSRPRATPNADWFVPIIPDIRTIRAFDNQYNQADFGVDAELPYRAFPSLSIEDFDKRYGKLMKRRIGRILLTYKSNFGFKVIKGFIVSRIYKKIKNVIDTELRSRSFKKGP